MSHCTCTSGPLSTDCPIHQHSTKDLVRVAARNVEKVYDENSDKPDLWWLLVVGVLAMLSWALGGN